MCSSVRMNLLCSALCVFLCVRVARAAPSSPEVLPKTVVHVFGEEHFLRECSFEGAGVKSVTPALKAPIFQLLDQPLFLLVKTSERGANAVFLPQGLSTPETHPPVSPSIDTMLRSYEERHCLVFSLAHFPFKQFKELALGDFLSNGRTLRPGVPLTDLPVLAFYTKQELDELKPVFKFFYMGDLEVTATSVSSNRKSALDMPPPPPPAVGVPMTAGYKSDGYPYANRLPGSHPQKHAFFLAPVPVILPHSPDALRHHDAAAAGNHNILNRSAAAQEERTASDLPVYSYPGAPMYLPRGRQSTTPPAPQQSPQVRLKSILPDKDSVKSAYPEKYSLPAGVAGTEFPLEASTGRPGPSSSPGPQPYSLPSGQGQEASPQQVSLVFPASPSQPKPYSLPSGYGGINEGV